ncbi:Ubiquitin thioesterase OTU1 [Halotydeus destructor]|nr:Ubiquitin thioesterase OTU1 [Halotydeus destructor]
MALAPTQLVLRCKTREGQHMLESLTSEDRVEDLKAILFSLTSIYPEKQRILAGYPLKQLDLSDGKRKLGSLFSSSKDTLIVEEVVGNLDNRPTIYSKQNVQNNSNTRDTNYISDSSTNVKQASPGVLLRRPVPANNSCLFTSVYFCLSGGEYNDVIGFSLRQIIADTVAADPETYNEGFLGKPNREYCTWILNEEHWGGAIELSILSKYYQSEMVAVDTQNVRLNRFGEDANYSQRVLLIYDGIHYDPLMLESLSNNRKIQTVFPLSDAWILDMALEVAREAKASRQFTDVQHFTLRCLVCNKKLTGQSQAQQHAKESGHINFGEV